MAVFPPKASFVKGENLVRSGHVITALEHQNDGQARLDGQVLRQTSIGKPPVKVEIKLDANRNIISKLCSCVAGKAGRCKHIAAVILHVGRCAGESKTSEPQAWGRPSQAGKAKYGKGRRMEQIYPPCNPVFASKLDPFKFLTASPSPFKAIADASMETEELKISSEVLSYLVEEAVKFDDNRRYEDALSSLVPSVIPVPMLQPLLPLIEYILFYNSEVSIGEDGCHQVAMNTVSQSESATWRSQRALRISASSDAHRLLKGRDLSKIAGNIVFCSGPCKDLPNFVYGRNNATAAIEKYCAENSVLHVRPGLLIHPKQPYLCASPDTLILNALGHCSRLLEVKCPISCKNSEVVDGESGAPKVKYLSFNSGVYTLRPTHQYYTQVQMQMYVSGAQIVHLYVYSPVNTVTVEIPRDNNFLQQAIPKLTKAYFLHLLPQILQKSRSSRNGPSPS